MVSTPPRFVCRRCRLISFFTFLVATRSLYQLHLSNCFVSTQSQFRKLVINNTLNIVHVDKKCSYESLAPSALVLVSALVSALEAAVASSSFRRFRCR